MVRLPISGVRAHWRPATGTDDMALADSRPGLAGALAYASAIAVLADGSDLDAAALPVGDLDLLVVARRRELRGDTLVAEGRCEQCGAAVDVQFSLAAYADHHRPRLPRRVTEAGAGWFLLPAHRVAFRVPTVADVLAAAGADDPRGALLARCVRPAPDGSAFAPDSPVPADFAPSGKAGRAVEQAMAALAPTLRAEVAGSCPECAAPVLLEVDARELCLAELRFLAGSVYDDVNLIATVYRWSQEAILALPSGRRRRYADLIAGQPSEPSLTGAGVG
ncbi:MAG: hypothetical protein JO144_16025 [Actinobacteria bacterium]|nr:hypothetical protein [Actinomycetota bacterium]